MCVGILDYWIVGFMLLFRVKGLLVLGWLKVNWVGIVVLWVYELM